MGFTDCLGSAGSGLGLGAGSYPAGLLGGFGLGPVAAVGLDLVGDSVVVPVDSADSVGVLP